MISRNIKLTRLRPHSDHGALRKERLEWWLNNTPNVHHPVLHEVTLNPVRSMSINNLRIVNNWLIGDIHFDDDIRGEYRYVRDYRIFPSITHESSHTRTTVRFKIAFKRELQ